MEQLAVDLAFEAQENVSNDHAINPLEVHIIENTTDQTHSVFYRNQLLAQYQLHDNYTRNIVIVQLHQCHKVSQKTLSHVFKLTVQHISTLVCQYREKGSEGIQNRLAVRIGNNQKIKGKIAEEIIKQLSVTEEKRPTYIAVVKHIKKSLTFN